MVSYDLVERLSDTSCQIELELQTLQQVLNSCRLLMARVFELSVASKDTEHDLLVSIPAVQRNGKAVLAFVLRHCNHLFIRQQSENRSDKAAACLSGIICLQVTAAKQQDLLARTRHINALKATFEKAVIVNSGLPPIAHSEWVYRHLSGLIIPSAYRVPTPLIDSSTICFGWINKYAIENLICDQVLMMLEKSLQPPWVVPLWICEQQQNKLEREYQDIAALSQRAWLKIKWPVKVQLIVRVWYASEQRQVRYAYLSPLIAPTSGGQEVSVPDIDELLNYDADSVRYRYKPGTQSLRSLIPYLHLQLASK